MLWTQPFMQKQHPRRLMVASAVGALVGRQGGDADPKISTFWPIQTSRATCSACCCAPKQPIDVAR